MSRGRKKTNWHDEATQRQEREVRVVVESRVRYPRGPEFREKRVGLGIAAADLVGRREAGHLMRLENGEHGEPTERHWAMLRAALRACVLDLVEQGRSVNDIHFNAWSAAEIQKAAREP